MDYHRTKYGNNIEQNQGWQVALYFESNYAITLSKACNSSVFPMSGMSVPVWRKFVVESILSSNQARKGVANGLNLGLTFTGKELDEETGFGYFGARYYDATLLTSWTAVDPMSDKYPSISPYAYCAWNPMKLVDPDGEEIFGALIGACIGFTSELVTQTITHGLENLEKGDGFFSDWNKNIDVADVIVSTATGALNGLAPGAGTYVGRVLGDVAKAGFDWKPGADEGKQVNDVFNGKKSIKDAGLDLITNLIADFGGDWVTSDFKSPITGTYTANSWYGGIAKGAGIGTIQSWHNSFTSSLNQIVKRTWRIEKVEIEAPSYLMPGWDKPRPYGKRK